ncbi:MAG: prepilin-type N-terminal cleavage/methylation domain-containing protein [Phormidium tanganyikae FI6-MK23]|jgi:prepilin-type N-terminal cleavage/methylation domain-containing protein|nr:prepilin-type N-terminal cleavage/methylation domain-containing protein [Phormidium tanganyikae FI6-MK23]
MVKSFLKRYRKVNFLPDSGGFTLVELLVAMVVGSLISAGLLFIVVQLVQTNLRESARSDTQRDLQAAIDYIARDVREAVYVYDATCLLDRPSGDAALCPGLRSYLPESITGTSGFGTSDNVPVLAFWRVDSLPENLRTSCEDKAISYSVPPLPAEIQGVPCLSGRMYTLVVYSLNKESGRAVSRGRARIMRYKLPQFTSGSVRTGTSPQSPASTQGWVDPRGQATSFLAWPVDKSTLLPGATLSSLQTARPEADNSPLTDFVDWDGLYNLSTNPVSRGRAPNRSSEGLILTPQNATGTTTDPPRGFYVYVKGARSGGNLNQEVLIRIQGDAARRPGIPDTAANRPIVPISLETRVLTRGVTNKTQ